MPRNYPYKERDYGPRWVYFIAAPGVCKVKIGFVYAKSAKSAIASANKRIQEFYTGCPIKLTLLGVTNQYTEEQLHLAFNKQRHYREWFALTPKIRAFIRRVSTRPLNKPENNCPLCGSKLKRGTA